MLSEDHLLETNVRSDPLILLIVSHLSSIHINKDVIFVLTQQTSSFPAFKNRLGLNTKVLKRHDERRYRPSDIVFLELKFVKEGRLPTKV